MLQQQYFNVRQFGLIAFTLKINSRTEPAETAQRLQNMYTRLGNRRISVNTILNNPGSAKDLLGNEVECAI